MTEETWGPWIEHDGKGRPVAIGTVVNGIDRAGQEEVWVCGMAKVPRSNGKPGGHNLWTWAHRYPLDGDVIRYRIRKPRGLTILENLIADLPAPVQPSVNA